MKCDRGVENVKSGTLRLMAFASAIVFCLFLVSCGHSVNTIENTNKSMKRDFIPNKRIITDKGTSAMLQVRRLDKVKLPSGLLKVQVELRNAAKRTFQFSYRFLWFDKHGMLVETPAGTWIQKSIRSGDSAYISSVAPTPSCDDFQLKIIERK